MADKYEFETILFNNEEFILVQRIPHPYLGEVLQCLGDDGRVYINNNEIITNQEIIDNLDEQYWRSPRLTGIREETRHNSIRDLNKDNNSYER